MVTNWALTWLALYAILAYTVLGEESEPKILVDAEDFHGFPSSFGGLEVKTNDVPGSTFQWYHNGNLIGRDYKLKYFDYSTKKFYVDSSSSNRQEYAGTYQFFMNTPVGTIAGRKVKVAFTYSGEFSDAKKDDSRNVVLGQENFITCPEHTSGRNVIYKWGAKTDSGGAVFINYSPRYIVLNNGTLFFSHLTKDDMSYMNNIKVRCGMETIVDNDNRFKWSHIVKMQNRTEGNFTEFGPEIVTKLPNRVIVENDTISMKCAAAGRPVPTYTWKKIDIDGKEKPIENNKDGIIFTDQIYRVLVIQSANKFHAGRYICTATIGDKSDTVEGYLRYKEKPTWVGEKIKSVSPSIFSNHSWQCNAIGIPQPTYSWFVNGSKPANSSANIKITDGKIMFTNLRIEDSGMYQCIADNGVDNIYQTARLNVQAYRPRFDSNTGKTTLFLDNEGTIKCNAPAAPTAKNRWMKDGVEIDLSLPRYELRDENLVIKKVSKADIGNYTCTAENIYGKDVKKIQVEVVGEIKFVEEPRNKSVVRGSQFNLLCKAEGDRPVKYKWEYNGSKLKSVRDSIVWSLETHILLFINAQVEQSGSYVCIAYIDEPSYAEKRRSATVRVRGPPEPPHTVEVDGDCTAFEAKLSWKSTPRSYDPVKNFVIQKSNSYENHVWRNYTDEVAPGVRDQEVQNLSPFARYRFRVLAVNDIGISKPSDPTNFDRCETPPEAPIVCPKLHPVVGNAEELTVKWEKMDLIDQNGPNFTYRLQYRKKGDPLWKAKTFNGVELEFKVPEAGVDKEWEFKMQAENGNGLRRGPSCMLEARSGQDVPNKPSVPAVKGVGEDVVRVTFRKGGSFKGGIKQFYVLYRIKGQEGDWKKTETAYLRGKENRAYVDVPGLNKTIEYEFVTVAVNSAGESDRSDSNSTYPGEPTNPPTDPSDTPVALKSPVYKKSWFIAVVVVVCFLLLVLLAMLLITRKRGERYPVGKREKKRAGILDDAEEAESDSYPMKPPRNSGNGLKRNISKGSLPNKDPDRDSLDEYGEDRFGEDAASFIGQYNDDKKAVAVDGPEYV